MMKKHILILSLACLFTLGTMAQTAVPSASAGNQPAQGEPASQPKTPLDAYRAEMKTAPQETTHKMERHRRTATRHGNREMKHDNFTNAVTRYRQALAADSAYHRAQYNKAYAHARLGQPDSALAYYRHAIDNPYATLHLVQR